MAREKIPPASNGLADLKSEGPFEGPPDKIRAADKLLAVRDGDGNSSVGTGWSPKTKYTGKFNQD
jgi:hypothetical protein